MNEWIGDLIANLGYLGVALLMLLETVFPPIPSEVIMPMAGIASATGGMSIWGVIAAGTAGAMAGNILWYLFARALGVERFRPLIRRWGRWLTVSVKDVERADAWFDRRGWLFVMLGRMTPTLRSLVSVPAGLFAMPFATFLLASSVGTLGWTTMLALLGLKLGEDFERIDTYLGPVSIAIVALMAAWYLYRVATWKPHD